MGTCHLNFEEHFASIETQLARLSIELQALFIQSSQLYRVQHQTEPLREEGAVAAGPPPPLVPPWSRHSYYITQLHFYNDNNTINRKW